ncbi:MAG: Smr/MutS family protein [Pyrinomonadaceae bacterium]|nr:Smr/MutS family protein [Pyrinomonadaceae bacterium]
MSEEDSNTDPFGEPVDLEITDSLDLHAFNPKDVRAVTTAYLEEARKKGFRFVRLIHGKGIGVQREIVRKVLEETAFVKGFKSGDEFSGGWGATIAELEANGPQ